MQGGYGYWVTAFLAAFSGSVPATEGNTDVISGSLAGWAEIDAHGRVQRFTADGVANPALLEATIDQLKRFEFVPAQGVEGPVQARAYLTGVYELRPDGDDVLLTVRNVRAGPKVTKRVMPKPPLRLMTDLTPTLSSRIAFTIQADGRPADILLEEPPKSGEFARELRDAIGKWRFEPASAGAISQAVRYRQDIGYYTKGATPPRLPDCPPDTSGNAKVTGQTSCLPRFEVMWSEAETLGREVRVENPR